MRGKKEMALFLTSAMILSLLLVPAGAAELTEYASAGSMTELYAAVSGGARQRSRYGASACFWRWRSAMEEIRRALFTWYGISVTTIRCLP